MAIKQAQGGDGWSHWTADRHGDDMRVVVTSNVESKGGKRVVLLDATIRDASGFEAVRRAESCSADYAYRMAI